MIHTTCIIIMKSKRKLLGGIQWTRLVQKGNVDLEEKRAQTLNVKIIH